MLSVLPGAEQIITNAYLYQWHDFEKTCVKCSFCCSLRCSITKHAISGLVDDTSWGIYGALLIC